MSRKQKGGNAVRATRKQLLGRASDDSIGHAQPKVNSRNSFHTDQHPSYVAPGHDSRQRGKIYGGCRSTSENRNEFNYI